MSNANPPESSTDSSGITIQRPTLIGILYLANFVTGFSVIVGVVLAYVWRGEAETAEWEKTHYTYHIRTFWIGLAVSILLFLGYFLAIFGVIFADAGGEPPPAFFVVIIGFVLGWLLAAAWYLARCILPLVKCSKREPMPKPDSWLF